jgi:hypothetical protein
MSREYRTLSDFAADPTLDDDVVVKDEARPDWSITVGELRAAHAASSADEQPASYAAPDSFAPHLAALKAASATPASDFETTYKAQRMAEFAAEDAQIAAMRAARGMPEPTLRVLTNEELSEFAPPNPYLAREQK